NVLAGGAHQSNRSVSAIVGHVDPPDRSTFARRRAATGADGARVGRQRTMYFKQFLDERCGCASYLVASRMTGEAAVIDPAIVIEPYEELLAERKFRLRYVLDTHVHADHVSGGRLLAGKYGAELCL